MYLSANIQQIRDYVSHLEQERCVAEDLAYYLCEWREQAIDLGENELSFVDRHLHIAQNHILYINDKLYSVYKNLVESLINLRTIGLSEATSLPHPEPFENPPSAVIR